MQTFIVLTLLAVSYAADLHGDFPPSGLSTNADPFRPVSRPAPPSFHPSPEPPFSPSSFLASLNVASSSPAEYSLFSSSPGQNSPKLTFGTPGDSSSRASSSGFSSQIPGMPASTSQALPQYNLWGDNSDFTSAIGRGASFFFDEQSSQQHSEGPARKTVHGFPAAPMPPRQQTFESLASSDSSSFFSSFPMPAMRSSKLSTAPQMSHPAPQPSLPAAMPTPKSWMQADQVQVSDAFQTSKMPPPSTTKGAWQAVGMASRDLFQAAQVPDEFHTAHVAEKATLQSASVPPYVPFPAARVTPNAPQKQQQQQQQQTTTPYAPYPAARVTPNAPQKQQQTAPYAPYPAARVTPNAPQQQKKQQTTPAASKAPLKAAPSVPKVALPTAAQNASLHAGRAGHEKASRNVQANVQASAKGFPQPTVREVSSQTSHIAHDKVQRTAQKARGSQVIDQDRKEVQESSSAAAPKQTLKTVDGASKAQNTSQVSSSASKISFPTAKDISNVSSPIAEDASQVDAEPAHEASLKVDSVASSEAETTVTAVEVVTEADVQEELSPSKPVEDTTTETIDESPEETVEDSAFEVVEDSPAEVAVAEPAVHSFTEVSESKSADDDVSSKSEQDEDCDVIDGGSSAASQSSVVNSDPNPSIEVPAEKAKAEPVKEPLSKNAKKRAKKAKAAASRMSKRNAAAKAAMKQSEPTPTAVTTSEAPSNDATPAETGSASETPFPAPDSQAVPCNVDNQPPLNSSIIEDQVMEVLSLSVEDRAVASSVTPDSPSDEKELPAKTEEAVASDPCHETVVTEKPMPKNPVTVDGATRFLINVASKTSQINFEYPFFGELSKLNSNLEMRELQKCTCKCTCIKCRKPSRDFLAFTDYGDFPAFNGYGDFPAFNNYGMFNKPTSEESEDPQKPKYHALSFDSIEKCDTLVEEFKNKFKSFVDEERVKHWQKHEEFDQRQRDGGADKDQPSCSLAETVGRHPSCTLSDNYFDDMIATHNAELVAREKFAEFKMRLPLWLEALEEDKKIEEEALKEEENANYESVAAEAKENEKLNGQGEMSEMKKDESVLDVAQNIESPKVDLVVKENAKVVDEFVSAEAKETQDSNDEARDTENLTDKSAKEDPIVDQEKPDDA